MKARIFEIFTSIEGEGILFGTKTLFVRLAGCPFTCFYCDTIDALPMDSGNEYTIDEALTLIDRKLENKTYKVNFTGGEPLTQHKAVSEMAKHVKSKNMLTYIESSCFDSEKFSEVIPYIDYVKIEFKTKDSNFVDTKHYPELLGNALNCLSIAVSANKSTYIKIVVSSKTQLQQIKDLTENIFRRVSPEKISGFVIQPTYGIAEPNLKTLMGFYDIVYPYYNEVRIIPQLHKFIGAP